MRQKTKKPHENQVLSHIPSWVQMRAKNSHAWAPLKKVTGLHKANSTRILNESYGQSVDGGKFGKGFKMLLARQISS